MIRGSCVHGVDVYSLIEMQQRVICRHIKDILAGCDELVADGDFKSIHLKWREALSWFAIFTGSIKTTMRVNCDPVEDIVKFDENSKVFILTMDDLFNEKMNLALAIRYSSSPDQHA